MYGCVIVSSCNIDDDILQSFEHLNVALHGSESFGIHMQQSRRIARRIAEEFQREETNLSEYLAAGIAYFTGYRVGNILSFYVL